MTAFLLSYVMYNFDLGYVQGMSDLLSPILFVMQNEVDAFWCFAKFMERVKSNFDLDQGGMKRQLGKLIELHKCVDPGFYSYLATKESGNFYFCFRWLLIWFKREFSFGDTIRLWEVLWTRLPWELKSIINHHRQCSRVRSKSKQIFEVWTCAFSYVRKFTIYLNANPAFLKSFYWV